MNNKIKYKIITISFFIFLITFFIINVVKRDDLVSLSERRKLTQKPKATISNILDGAFFEKFDEYTTDQFFLREFWRSLKFNFEKNIYNQRVFNDIYEYNEYLIEQNYFLSQKSLDNIITKINDIIDDNLTSNNKIYYSIVPDKNYYVDSFNLKIDYDKISKSFSDNIKGEYINLFDTLSLESYYYTDSHWKQSKIVNTANKIREQLGFSEFTDFNSKKITDFKGVYSGRYTSSKKEDEIVVLSNDVIESSKVFSYIDEKFYDIYDLNKVSSNDKYDIYLSGAQPLIKMINNSNKSGKELIIFRDSFASSMAPLLLNDYSSIILVDTRYIAPKLLKDFIEFGNQDVLFMYSVSVINESSGLK